MSSKEYNEGYESYWHNGNWKDNPYDPNTIQYRDWKEGFDIALLEDSDSYNAYYGEID